MLNPNRREFILQSAGALGAVAILPNLGLGAYRTAAPVSVGLVGAGRQGRLILAELAKIEQVKVAAICDTDASRRESGSKRAAGSEAFADHKAMLDKLKDLSAVVIATPTHLHKQIALDCLAAGKHVYCEAPLAHTVEDCRAIAAAAAGAGKQVFACGFEGRSNPIYKLARTFFRSDAVRDFVSAEAQSFKKESWRFPAPPGSDAAREKAENWRLDPAISTGLAGELGAQQFDVVHWYLNKLPTSVFGTGAVLAQNDGREVADSIHCNFGFESNARFAFSASVGNSYGGRFEVLRGTNAAIKLAWTHGWMFKEADAPTQGWEVYANRQQFFNDEGITLIADATKLAEQGNLKEGVGLPNKSLYYALADFLMSVTENKPVACDAATGAKSTIVAILANQAVVKNQILTIDPALFSF
ncbi:MAG: Gfo/Idh/MocA family oxidoreductase [Phycisphaerales bacterium]|nr:Gfo/Idh/MocA family oxidoreductase [Phycisphaerales bacterium]